MVTVPRLAALRRRPRLRALRDHRPRLRRLDADTGRHPPDEPTARHRAADHARRARAAAEPLNLKTIRCTDPHDPPAAINERPRDVVDLLLLRDLARTEGRPTLLELRVAAEAIFAARAADARALGRAEHTWPCVVVAHEQWRPDFAAARVASYVDVTLEDAVAKVNADQLALTTGLHDALRAGGAAWGRKGAPVRTRDAPGRCAASAAVDVHPAQQFVRLGDRQELPGLRGHLVRKHHERPVTARVVAPLARLASEAPSSVTPRSRRRPCSSL